MAFVEPSNLSESCVLWDFVMYQAPEVIEHFIKLGCNKESDGAFWYFLRANQEKRRRYQTQEKLKKIEREAFDLPLVGFVPGVFGNVDSPTREHWSNRNDPSVESLLQQIKEAQTCLMPELDTRDVMRITRSGGVYELLIKLLREAGGLYRVPERVVAIEIGKVQRVFHEACEFHSYEHNCDEPCGSSSVQRVKDINSPITTFRVYRRILHMASEKDRRSLEKQCIIVHNIFEYLVPDVVKRIIEWCCYEGSYEPLSVCILKNHILKWPQFVELYSVRGGESFGDFIARRRCGSIDVHWMFLFTQFSSDDLWFLIDLVARFAPTGTEVTDEDSLVENLLLQIKDLRNHYMLDPPLFLDFLTMIDEVKQLLVKLLEEAVYLYRKPSDVLQVELNELSTKVISFQNYLRPKTQLKVQERYGHSCIN